MTGDSYSGDVRLYSTPDGAEIYFADGQPEMFGGLANAVLLSLSCLDYWGNAVSGFRYDSELLKLATGRILTEQMRLDALSEAARLLSWLTESGLAAKVRVAGSIENLRTLKLLVQIEEPSGETEAIAFRLTWEGQRAAIEAAG